jgi:hypothetical protein
VHIGRKNPVECLAQCNNLDIGNRGNSLSDALKRAIH